MSWQQNQNVHRDCSGQELFSLCLFVIDFLCVISSWVGLLLFHWPRAVRPVWTLRKRLAGAAPALCVIERRSAEKDLLEFLVLFCCFFCFYQKAFSVRFFSARDCFEPNSGRLIYLSIYYIYLYLRASSHFNDSYCRGKKTIRVDMFCVNVLPKNCAIARKCALTSPLRAPLGRSTLLKLCSCRREKASSPRTRPTDALLDVSPEALLVRVVGHRAAGACAAEKEPTVRTLAASGCFRPRAESTLGRVQGPVLKAPKPTDDLVDTP